MGMTTSRGDGYYRSLVEQANAIVVCWQMDGTITYVNKFCCSFFGYQMSELVGRNVVGSITPEVDSGGEDLRPLMREIAEVPHRYESNVNENIKKNGDRVWVSWTNKLLRDESGEHVGAISIGIDVTAQRKLEQDLRQSQKMQAVGLLAGGVAHDFNNLLQGVAGFAELILEETDRTLIEKYAQQIINASDQAAQLTEKLLSFARKDGVTRTETSLSELVAEAVGLVENTISPNVRIEIAKQCQNAKILADRGTVVSAMVNLLINADDSIKRGTRGTITVDYYTQEFLGPHQLANGVQLRSGAYAVLSVSDDGIGIAPDAITKIFDPFYTSKGLNKGTGLGLSGVYTVADAHGGAIECRSKLGEGSLFSLYLRQDNTYEKASKVVPTVNDTKKYRFLLVDDEQMVRDFSYSLLSKKGHEVHAFEFGSDAIRFYSGHNREIDFVIVDMLMPEMDGIEVLSQLKEINPEVKSILSTGYASGEQMSRARGAGFNKILRKPFIYRELIKAVNGL